MECDAARTENEALQSVRLSVRVLVVLQDNRLQVVDVAFDPRDGGLAMAVVGLEPGALRQHTAIAS
eukprot:369959-Prorocentrum_minimum.AAC.1